MSGATSYAVYRSVTGADGAFTQIAETTTTSYDDVHHDTNNPLDLCWDYWYAVSAWNAAGEGPLSVPDKGYRGTKVTGVPTVTASDGLYATKIVVEWNRIQGATTYTVYRSDSYTGAYDQIDTTADPGGTATKVTFEDDTFLPGGTHEVSDYWEKTFYYKVKACGDGLCGCGGVSAPESGYVTRVPGAPTGVQASEGTDPTKVVITWTAVDRADRYEVYRSTSQTGTYTKIGETTHPTTTYNDTTATPGTTYWYKVKACNAYGCGPLSTADSGYSATGS